MTQKQESPAFDGALEHLAWRLDASEYTRSLHDPQPLAGPRFEHLVERVHTLGPRPIGELLAEIATATGEHALIADLVEAYAALDPEIVRAVGGDRFPPMPLEVVR
jgi:hypothetical protein